MAAPRAMKFAVLLTFMPATAFANRCTAVQPNKCGSQWYNSCLACGTKSNNDCEKCCPGCSLIKKAGGIQFCVCDGPAPAPPGNDTWANYEIAGMAVTSVVGGKDSKAYEKAVILLHGGGESGAMWPALYSKNWFGNLTGIKYVFPTTAIHSHVWFITYKNGCGLAQDCAYNVTSIRESAGRVASLVEHEAALLGGDASKVYVGGFSEGAQLAGYLQLAHLDFALAGTIIMDGFPLPPLFDMPGHDPAAAKRNASYYGTDMRWMLWWGALDPIFPVDVSLRTWNGIFDVLGVRSCLEVEHTEPGMTHTVVRGEMAQLVDFVRNESAYAQQYESAVEEV